jgi:hypothetical protein
MKANAIIDHKGYLQDRFIGLYPKTQVDLEEETERLWSSGWDEPIISIGMRKRYELVEVELPEWLLEGLAKLREKEEWTRDIDEVAARIIFEPFTELEYALKKLVKADNRKFYNSLRQFFRDNGFLSKKQMAAVNDPHYFRRRRTY